MILAEQAALAEFLAEADRVQAAVAPPEPPAPPEPRSASEPVVEFAPAPIVRPLPTSFIRVVEVREPVHLVDRAVRWVRRNKVSTAVALAVACVIALQWWSSRPQSPQSSVALREPNPPKRVTDARVFEVVEPLIRETLIAGPTAEFSPHYVVNWGEDYGHGDQSCSIGGTLKVRNKFGVPQDITWEVTGDARHVANEFDYREIKLNGVVAKESPRWAEFKTAAALLFGNAVSDQPPEIAREIRRVKAIVEDEVRKRIGTSPFELEWPDDPSRNEPQIMVDGTKHWHVDGMVRLYSTTRKMKVQGHFERHTGKVVRLYLGSKWVVGSAPPAGDPSP